MSKQIKKIKKALKKLQAGENIIIEYHDEIYDVLGIDDDTVFLCDSNLIEYTKEQLFNEIIKG